MDLETSQLKVWKGEFGRKYTDRNTMNVAEMDDYYRRNFGVSRTEMNHRFLASLPRDMRILEVGANVGNQLLGLRQMGFTRLYGIEIQPYAIEKARKRLPEATIIEGSAFAIPFADRYFELVFTSGVLIHIKPSELPLVMGEMHRCTNRFIWGYEYYAEELAEVVYRGEGSLLWKGNYPGLFQQDFADLQLVDQQLYPYLSGANVDIMYLLSKKSEALP